MVFLLCFQVFCSRILDVSLATVRTILTVRGRTLLAAGVGFCEVFIWFLVVRSALDSDVNTFLLAISYAGGFAVGTFVGGRAADKFFGGIINVQVITSSRSEEVICAIRDAGFAVSVLNVNSSQFGDEKYMLVIEVKSTSFKKLETLLHELDPGAFLMARETKYIQNGFIK